MSHSDDLCSRLPCSLVSPNPFFFALFLSLALFSPPPRSAERRGTKAINAKRSQILSLYNHRAASQEHKHLWRTLSSLRLALWQEYLSLFYLPPRLPRSSYKTREKGELGKGSELVGRGDTRKRTCWKHDGGSNSPVLMLHSCANVVFHGCTATVMRRTVFTQTRCVRDCVRGRGIVTSWTLKPLFVCVSMRGELIGRERLCLRFIIAFP